MYRSEIISALNGEIEKLQQAKSILSGSSTMSNHRGTSAHIPKKRMMSAEARARIGAAQRKRWRLQKAAKKAA